MAPVNMPFVTVVIPTYGEKGVGLVETCLASLARTHGVAKPEILVVSDGDEQETLEQLELVCAVYDNARLLPAERGGFAHACNIGIAAANGALGVFLVNNDIEFCEPTLLILSDALGVLNAGVIGCRLLYPDGTIQHGGVVHVPAAADAPVPGYFDHRYRGQAGSFPYALRIYPSLVTGALLGISRWYLDVVGPLDERFGFAVEDIDVCLNTIEAGHDSLYCGYTAAVHHEGATRGRTLEEKQARHPELIERENEALRRLHAKWVGLDWKAFE